MFRRSYLSSYKHWNIATMTNLNKIPYPAETEVFKTLQDVLKMSRRLTTKQDVVTTSGKRRSIYDVLKTRDLRHLDGVQFRTSWRCLIYNILRTSDLRRLEDVHLRCLEDFLFTTSWRCLIYDFLWTSDLRRLEDVCKAMSVKQRRSGVYATSKEMFFFLFCTVWNIQKILNVLV